MTFDFMYRDREDNINIKDIIAIGEVTAVDKVKLTARVTFDDMTDGAGNSFTSAWLPVLQRNTMYTKDYWCPDVGEDALCVFIPGGGGDGFILGSWYAGEVMPPTSDRHERMIQFPDGTELSYNRVTHKLKANAVGDVELTAAGNVTAAVQGNIAVTTAGNLDLTAGGNVTISGASVHINGDSE